MDNDVTRSVGNTFGAAETHLTRLGQRTGDNALELRIMVQFRKQHTEVADARTDNVQLETHFLI